MSSCVETKKALLKTFLYKVFLIFSEFYLLKRPINLEPEKELGISQNICTITPLKQIHTHKFFLGWFSYRISHLQWLSSPCHRTTEAKDFNNINTKRFRLGNIYLIFFISVNGSKAISQGTRPKVFRQTVDYMSILSNSFLPGSALPWFQTLVPLSFVPSINLGIELTFSVS